MQLRPISVDVLYDGMLVDFGIYAYQDGKSVLLCKNTVLDERKINFIRDAVKAGRNVYIKKENCDRILYENAYFTVVQRSIEKKVGYNEMKDMARDFVSRVHETGIISSDEVNEMVEDIHNKLSTFDNALITQCLNGIRGTDEYLYAHSLNVGFLNGMIAKWCGLDHEMCVKLIKAGLIHDLGKLKISPSILNKPGKLSKLEYESVKRHPEFGCNMLRESGEKDPVILDIVLHHHERINGTGYPEKQGANLSIGARITAISDIYDAMVAERPYKGASSPFVILQELADTSFAGLDMGFVRTMLKNMCTELLGKLVLLSNGAVAKVEYISETNPRYPIVSVDGEIIKTDSDLCCVRVYATPL